MSEKILFVDDEAAILQGYQRLLRVEFKITTAVGGKVGLLLLQQQGPFAVVVSDMRMPEMDGIQFLQKVKALAPDTIRIMLTGAGDLQTAINAVNEGNIFRFLTKPSTKEILVKTLTDGLEQYRLVCAEKELLEKTLRGTVNVLAELFSLVSPAVFSRSTRIRRYVRHLVSRLELSHQWRYEVAAMLSQMGCVTLDPQTIEAVYSGADLSPEEQAQYVNHPLVTQDLLKNIPRMESIAWMIAYQNRHLPADWVVGDREMADRRLGAQILRAALTFDMLLHKGNSRVQAVHLLTRRFDDLDKRIVEALIELEPEAAGQGIRTMSLAELTASMILEEEVRTSTGTLVASKGQEITSPLLLKLKSYSTRGTIASQVQVSPPVAHEEAPASATK